MNPRPRFVLLGVLLAGSVIAQQAGNFTLNEGSVHFSAPTEWSVIMQMTEGSRQVIAFQVKDPADTGSGEASRVSVTTRKLEDAKAFQDFVGTSMDKARQTPSYAEAAGGDSANLRYSGMNAKTKYLYRESYYYQNGIGIQLRCVHPVLKGTTQSWVSAFDQGCEQIAASLSH
ncbi:MAG: hypothetical protein ABI411_12015 [Tahibacter sp.]